MICLAFVTGPLQMANTSDVAQAPKIEYQPLPGTAIGGKRADEMPAAPAQAAPAEQPAQASNVNFDQVHGVIQERCAVCHSAKPTSPLFSSAPAGIMFDTPQQIQQLAPRIQAQAVASQIMPLGNITQMTQEERNLVGQWIAKGAQVN